MDVRRPQRASLLAGSFCIVAALGSVLAPAFATAANAVWTVSSAVNPSSNAILNGVSCASSTDCVAVGNANNGALPNRTLIESWNGTAWSVIPSPNPHLGANGSAILQGVSCTRANHCVAVGFHQNFNGGPEYGLIEVWDGVRWDMRGSPLPNTALQAVSCVSSSSCVAAGYDFTAPDVRQTLVETWDGSSWSVTPSSNTGSADSFYGVSCTSTSSCVAVGLADGSSATGLTENQLVETWNGSSWSVTPSPDPGDGYLTGVSCTTSSSCSAVGFQPSGTLVETWDGSSWSVTPSPDPGAHSNGLSGVSCVSVDNCVAVGVTIPADLQYRTLIETWDGSSWRVTPSPNPSTTINYLLGVSCPEANGCMAVGDAFAKSNGTLVSQPVAETSIANPTPPVRN